MNKNKNLFIFIIYNYLLLSLIKDNMHKIFVKYHKWYFLMCLHLFKILSASIFQMITMIVWNFPSHGPKSVCRESQLVLARIFASDMWKG